MTNPPIWPVARHACHRTARGCSRRPGSSGPSRRTSRRRTRPRRPRWPRPSSSTRSRPAGPRGRSRADLVPRSRAARPRSMRGRPGSRTAGTRASTSEPAWRARLPDDVAERPMQQVRARVVAHRVGASFGVDLGDDRLADRTGRAACRDGRSGRGCVPAVWVSVTREQHLAIAARATPRGRRPGRRPRRRTASDPGRSRPRRRLGPQLDLGRASSSSYASRRAGSRRRGPRRSWSRSPRNCVSPARPSDVSYSAVGSACADRSAFGRRDSRSRCSASAASNPARSTRTPYSAASSTVRSIGKPYVSWSRNATSPGSTGASAGRSRRADR